MQVYNEITPNLLDKSSCALGMFDGVHIGHQKVISSAKASSLKLDCPCVVISFSKHPQYVTAHTPTPQLTTLEDRLNLFEDMGVDIAIIIDFDKTFANILPQEYIKRYLVEGLHAKNISVGFDHRFGSGKRGNQNLLRNFAPQFGYVVQIISPVTVDGQIVSSSIIRKLLNFGEIKSANKLLGRDFVINGLVVKGAQRGRTLGYPTANVKPSGNILIPACGVYQVEFLLKRTGKKYPAVLNIGYRPTFSDRNIPTIEGFLIDFKDDIYNENIAILFKDKIRNEERFETADELVVQIEKDIEFAKQNNPVISKN